MKIALLAAAFSALATTSSAATISVGANASGQFGELYSGGLVMVEGATLSAGDKIQITASGMINVGGNLFTDANGIDLDSSTDPISASEYSPLEEAAVDANPSLAFNTLFPNLGALTGAFISQAVVDAAGFSARDTDFGGDISSSDLFFVGTSLVFEAGFDGTLFFGINEGFVSNNSGAFSVTVSPAPVPLPASGLLLIAGLGGLAAVRRRTTKH